MLTYGRANIWRTCFFLCIATFFPILFTGELEQEIWTGIRPLAWDGSGHFTLAQIYTNTIFPDTFGWTNSFFGGMPHPNNYPPLFYWLVALLNYSHLFSFLTSFKIVLVLPTLLLPAATGFLAWKVSNKSNLAAFCAALCITPLLVDYRFFISSGPLGISYISTFLTGLYSHPLGYLFLILWYAVYCDRRQTFWRVLLSAVLLAGAILSSFFGASITALFITVTLIYDLLKLHSVWKSDGRIQARRNLVGHFASPVIAGCLTLFWLAPVIATRDYIVTQPSSIPISELIPPVLLLWYLIAGAGIFQGLRRRQSASMGIYLTVCILLAVIIFSAGIISPHWFPLHPARLLATFNFLLAVPVGIVAAFLVKNALQFLGIAPFVSQFSEKMVIRRNQSNGKIDLPVKSLKSSKIGLKSWQVATTIILLVFGSLLIIKGIKPGSYGLAFYDKDTRKSIDPLLNFAAGHKDGRYLVETPSFSDIGTGHEGRAINNFLPIQGNEVLPLFFREASPSVIFFSPIVDRFSTQVDSTGISSVLSDDLDFAQQTTALHIRQARLMGVHYLVAYSPWARNLLQGQSDIKSRRDFGVWSIYELNGEPERRIRSLAYKPALVVSNLNLKGRRNNELGFVRFAEEQIFSGWFDVMLALSPEMKLDKLRAEDGFGSIVIDEYDYDDEQAAFDKLHEIAQKHPLILLENNSALFKRIQDSLSDFPQAVVINRLPEEPGEWLKPGAPTRSYETSQARQTWRQIQQELDRNKISISSTAAVTGDIDQERQNEININTTGTLAEPVPVLIDTTYHPNWQRDDGVAIYPTTPFFMLTFVREPTQLKFARRPSDWMGLAISAITLFLLCGSLIWFYGIRLVFRRRSVRPDNASLPSTDKEVVNG